MKTFSFILEWKIPSICVSNCPTAAVTLCFPIFLVYISQIMCFLSPHTKSQDLIPRVFFSHKKPYTLLFVIALHLHYFFSVIKQHCFIFYSVSLRNMVRNIYNFVVFHYFFSSNSLSDFLSESIALNYTQELLQM